ncbi:MAG TPA: xanthine dehydrogenase accessory protein XdhC [Deltaproteobacteria bacterium]|nr:xanthine dehydrogenase accessory protein XdhC [Deltaproteobacteria bacterium]
MDVFAAAAEARRTGRRAALVTVIGVGGSTPRASGARMLVYEDDSIVGTIGGGALEHRARRAAIGAIEAGRPERLAVHLTQDLGMCCGGRMEVYIDPIQSRVPMVVFGAGHVARATVPLLHALDFDVTIVDERDELALPEAFPHATLHTQDPLAYARALDDDPHAHWLVVTHDHRLDQDLVEILLPKTCAWIGMIGSRAKVARFFVRYRAAGVPEALFRKLSAPVGLDLGAETPAEIAVAIAAELVRVRRRADRPPLPLSALPLPARGGDGQASPPLWDRPPS